MIPDQEFKILFETAPGLSLVLLPDFTIAAVTNQYLQATMLSRESMLGRGLFDVFPDNPDDNEATGVSNLRASLNFVLNNGTPHSMQVQKYDIRRPDGVFEIRYWQPLNTPVFNSANELIYIIHNVEDVTAGNKANERLQKVDNNFHSLMSSVKDYSIFLLDKNGYVVSWNQGAELIYGYTTEEITGKHMDVFYTVQELEKGEPKQNLQKVLQQGYLETEGWRVKKDGAAFYASIVFTSLMDGSGNLYGYSKVTRDTTEKRKAEENVLFLANIADNIQDIVITSTIDFIITRWNPGAERLLEWKSAEVLGKTTVEILKVIYPHQSRTEIVNSFAAQGFWQGEVIFTTKSGRPLNMMITASQLKDAEGNVTGNLTIAKDITDRIEAEQRLQEFKHFFNNSNDLSCIANKDGYFEILNPGFEKSLGYTTNELSNNPFLDFVHPDDIAITLEEYKKLKSGALVVNFQNRYRKKNGEYLWFDWNATPNPHTGKLYCIARDITDRKKAEDELSKLNEELELRVEERTAKIDKNEKRFRALLENNHDIISLLDHSFKVIYRSPSAYRVTGWTNEEVEKLDGTKNIHPDDKESALNAVSQLMTHPRIPVHTLFRNLHKDGRYLWLEGTVVNLLEDENVQAIVFNFRDVTERIAAEEKLALSELRFRSLIEHSAEGIAMTDEYSNNLYRSPSAQKMLGPVIKENAISLTHPQDKETLKAKHLEVLKFPGLPVPFQGRFLHASGYYIWLEGTFTNLLHVQGINAIVANYRDITERKKLEDLLYKANTLARIGSWEVDMSKGTVYWSDITREIHETGYDYVPDLATGINFYKEGKGRELIKQKVTEAMESCKSWDVELQIITAKGNERWIRTIGESELVNGKCVRIYGSFQDIDQRKKSEEKVIKSERLYRSLFKNMRHGFAYCKVIADGEKLTDYTYLAVNRKYETLTGLKEIAGKNMSEVMPELLESNKDYIELIERVSISGKSERFETYVNKLSKWFSVSLYCPERGYFVSLLDDITERKQIEENINRLNTELEDRVVQRTAQLKKSNEELEAFSYSVSHDLRAPLRAIIGFTVILEEEYSSKLDNEAKRITSVIKDNTRKMGQLIDDLLKFSRMGRQELVKVNINTGQMVQDVMDNLNKKESDVKIEWVIHSLPAIEADVTTIRQVWVNLISNAIKYSSKATAPKIEIEGYVKDQQTIFTIKDNGVGFDEEYKNKLFKVFQRLHTAGEFEGTGVGLAIVEKIISKHGGNVWAEGKKNEGACFHFSLPLGQ